MTSSFNPDLKGKIQGVDIKGSMRRMPCDSCSPWIFAALNQRLVIRNSLRDDCARSCELTGLSKPPWVFIPTRIKCVFLVLNRRVEIDQVDDDDIDPETQRAANELNAQLIADLEATQRCRYS